MKYNTLLFEKYNNVGIVIINRPQSLNALNPEAYRELFDIFCQIEGDAVIQATIITGNGEKAFVAGTDISTMAPLSSAEAHEFAQIIRRACDIIDNSRKLVIAAINGYALGGGCELALCADYRIASENAIFGQPEINLGIFPGSGGTQRLPRLIGMARAKEMILMGGRINAKTALEWGLVDKVVPLSNLLNEARESVKSLLDRKDLN
jgi:enoyl-CoA hydratase